MIIELSQSKTRRSSLPNGSFNLRPKSELKVKFRYHDDVELPMEYVLINKKRITNSIESRILVFKT